MNEILNASLISYKFDEKNSVKGESQSSTYPGHPPEIAITISSIAVEAKISVLKKLKVGDNFEFLIKEDVDVPNSSSNYKKSGDETVSIYCEGKGSGEIKSISEIDQTLDDEDYQEVTIHLNKGAAEGM